LETKRDLEKAQSEAVEPVTATRVLSYTKASAMMLTLKKWLSPRGEIVADERTNTLIIRDIPSVLPDVDNLIHQLDRKSQQVEIEARVVSASRSFARDIGNQFAFSTTAVNGKNVFGGLSAVGTSPVFRPFLPGVSTSPALIFGTPPVASATPTPVNVAQPLSTNLAATTPTSGLTYLFTSPNFALDYMISAAESKGIGKLLSKPKIYTQNNEKGVVQQGNKIPIQTTINNTISVQFVDAVLKLEVTPQITADGTIFMNVLVENTQIDNGIPRVQGVPALDTQSVQTSVLVNDGGTVMIGGVNVTSQRTDINQVPIVGSLPVIGNLFKRTSVSVTSQELYFFLTPRVISN
jgi:type IV pilus assembly protein PilQ